MMGHGTLSPYDDELHYKGLRVLLDNMIFYKVGPLIYTSLQQGFRD